MSEPQEILVVLATNLRDVLGTHLRSTIAAAGHRLNAVYSDTPLPAATLHEHLHTASAFIIAQDKVGSAAFDHAPQLKIVAKYGVGTDNIDLIAAAEHGISVANCPGSNSNAVAELVVGLMITLSRNTQNLCHKLRAGQWSLGVGHEIAGKTVGMLGFGNIGRTVARYLRPFTDSILVHARTPNPALAAEYGVRYTALPELLEAADYLTVHLPLTPETRHMIDADCFGRMKRGVYLINAARGGIVDEQALITAVEHGTVAGAAMDVFEFEPPTASRMLQDDRFVVLPHIGAATIEAAFNMINMAMDNVFAVLAGRPTPNPVGGRPQCEAIAIGRTSDAS